MAWLAVEGFVASHVSEPASRWLTVGRGLVVGALLVALWRRYGELHRPVAAAPREWMLATLTGLGVFVAWIALSEGWTTFSVEREGFRPVAADGRTDWLLAALRLFGLALVVPVMEELFWRSFLMRWIERRDFLAVDPRRVGALAFALSSALFALEHSQWLAGLVAGAAYAWLYRRTGNLWIPVLSHAVTNGTLGFWILATGNWRFW
jgi:CAAX prenyl protease-like protein